MFPRAKLCGIDRPVRRGGVASESSRDCYCRAGPPRRRRKTTIRCRWIGRDRRWCRGWCLAACRRSCCCAPLPPCWELSGAVFGCGPDGGVEHEPPDTEQSVALGAGAVESWAWAAAGAAITAAAKTTCASFIADLLGIVCNCKQPAGRTVTVRPNPAARWRRPCTAPSPALLPRVSRRPLPGSPGSGRACRTASGGGGARDAGAGLYPGSAR